MTYVKAIGAQVVEYPYTIGRLRSQNSNVSFPKMINDQTLAEYNVYRVDVLEMPVVDDRTQKAARAATPTLSGDKWVLNWIVSNKTVEEIASYDAAVADRVRVERNQKLSDSDWVVVMNTEAGTGVPTEWAAYRQSLRDITDQAGFPHSVNWPVKP